MDDLSTINTRNDRRATQLNEQAAQRARDAKVTAALNAQHSPPASLTQAA